MSASAAFLITGVAMGLIPPPQPSEGSADSRRMRPKGSCNHNFVGELAASGLDDGAYPSQKNFVGRRISGGRLLCTGQLSAVCSSTSRCG